jgi:plastocyanin
MNRATWLAIIAAMAGTAGCGEATAPLAPEEGGAPTPSLAAVVNVTVQDNFYSPDPITVRQGSSAHWDFEGPSTHTATDDTGMGLYDSGFQTPGGEASFTFVAAGTYAYHCRVHDFMTGTVKVPLKVAPNTGGTGTTFTVTWASAIAPAGFVFDVQIRRPGASTFANWKIGRTARNASFVPDAGTGTYKFRALLRKTANGTKSQYSPAKKITVS